MSSFVSLEVLRLPGRSPLRAQQPERMRRIGVLQYINKSDPELQRRITVFVQGLQKLGWREGTNLVIDYR